ncbi:MAG: ABC transporter substrate-binding protein [Candidatus Dormiibacterota bacterium]
MALALVAIGALGFALSVHFGLIGGPQFTEGVVVSERPMSLNPLIDEADPAVVDVGHLLYRSLLKLDASGYPQPDLATSYTVSPNGLTYAVVLPATARWSNGSPITAADVIATSRFALSPQASDPTLAAALHGVTVAGDQAVVTFTLTAPRASFAATLTELPILPLGGLTAPQLANAAAHSTTPMPTSGPYAVQSTSTLRVLLAPNPHAVTRPAITSYELRLFVTFREAAGEFAAGDINALLATTPEELSTLLAVKGAQAEGMTTPDFVDLMFNERVGALGDSVVRHAIGIAISRTDVVSGALERAGGVVETGPFSDGLPWVGSSTLESVSPAVAEQVLKADGWVPGTGGTRHKGATRLAFTLDVPAIDPLPVVAREVARQLNAIGVEVTVKTVAPEDFLHGTLDTGDFQLAIDSWSPGPDPDVSAFWRSNAVPPRGYNVSGGPVDPFLDSALDTLAESPDRTLRISAAAHVAMLVADDAPAIFLYTPRVSMVFRSPMPLAPMPALGDEADRYNDIAAWQLR